MLSSFNVRKISGRIYASVKALSHNCLHKNFNHEHFSLNWTGQIKASELKKVYLITSANSLVLKEQLSIFCTYITTTESSKY